MNSNWSYSPETVKLGCDLCDLDLWPWPFAWTSLLSLVITPENFMMIGWWEHSQKGVTDRRTDRRTDWTIHRAAWSQLKINRPWPRTNQFWRWSRYISMQNFRPFPPCVLQEIPGNPKFDPFHQVKIVPKLQQGKSEGFESCDRPIIRKRPIWVKIGDVLSRVTLKFDGWPWKTIGHLSFAVSSFVQHFIAIGKFKLELLSGNAQFGSNSMIFRAVWPWNLTYDLEKQ